jgi:predicted anti-sigma-YlaC factor YlaD
MKGALFRLVLPGWLAVVALFLGSGCSVRKYAITQVGNALAAGGTTFTSDDDPELVAAAVPFSLKLMESLLAEVPEHDGLLLALTSGFTQYGYAFVQPEADVLEQTDFAAAERVRQRARRLYLRARDYGLRGLEAKHPGFQELLRSDPDGAAALCREKAEVPLLYWTAAAWGSAISLSKDDPATIVEIPQMEALIDRATALDPDWDEGAIDSFLISYEPNRQGAGGDVVSRVREHLRRAVELSGARQAGPFVAYAEAISVQEQNVGEFDALLAQALAINPDATPERRLVNLIMQRRARWLLAHREDLFVILEPTPQQP